MGKLDRIPVEAAIFKNYGLRLLQSGDKVTKKIENILHASISCCILLQGMLLNIKRYFYLERHLCMFI